MRQFIVDDGSIAASLHSRELVGESAAAIHATWLATTVPSLQMSVSQVDGLTGPCNRPFRYEFTILEPCVF